MSLTQYLLEFSICLALFYGLYHFLLRKETFFQLNRWYLLLTPAMAMIIPFLNMELPEEAAQNNWNQVIYPLVSNVQEPQMIFWQMVEAPAQSGWSITYLDLLLLIYLIGVLWMAGKLIYRTWRLMRLIGEGKKEVQKGYTLIKAKGDLPAASFLSYIFWEDGPLSPERKTILQHELVHVQQWHSLDVLLMEIWVLFKWFHPIIYWYRKSLRLTHEYIADDYVSKTSESPLAYAKLLTNCKIDTPSNTLVHHFHSSIKMRLIMMATKKSTTWNYFKILMIIPATAVLLCLFSFNLAKELPDSIVDRLQKTESAINSLADQPILSPDQSAITKTKDKDYKLKWGDIECNCRSEQYPNLYHCENQSFQPRQLRRLIRNHGGFELILEETPGTIVELVTMSKFMKDMGDFNSQLEEMRQGFNVDSPMWRQAKKGDVFHFYFDNDQGDHFEFDIVINNRKEELVFGHEIELGDYKFNLDLLNDYKTVYLDVEELKNLTESPLRVRKNNDAYYQLASVQMRNRVALRGDEWKNINATELDVRDAKSILDAYPGDNIGVTVEANNGQKLNFSISLRKNSSWNGAKRKFHLVWEWGSKSYGYDLLYGFGTSIVYSTNEIKELLQQDLYLTVNGERHLVKDPKLMIYPHPEFSKGVDNMQPRSMSIDEYTKNISPGDLVTVLPQKVVGGKYLTPNFRFKVDHDWKKIFADRPDIMVSEDGNKITIQYEQEIDLTKLLNEEIPFYYLYGFSVEGMNVNYMKYPFHPKKIREFIESQEDPKKIVLSRTGTDSSR